MNQGIQLIIFLGLAALLAAIIIWIGLRETFKQ
jgi:hypothetical protein